MQESKPRRQHQLPRMAKKLLLVQEEMVKALNWTLLLCTQSELVVHVSANVHIHPSLQQRIVLHNWPSEVKDGQLITDFQAWW